MNKTRIIIVDGIEIHTSLSATEIADLEQKNKELKKQLENKYEKVGTLTSELLYEENTKLINQQQEFIKYLEDKIKKLENNHEHLVVDMFGSYDLNDIELKLLKEILQKYKETIGVSNDY